MGQGMKIAGYVLLAIGSVAFLVLISFGSYALLIGIYFWMLPLLLGIIFVATNRTSSSKLSLTSDSGGKSDYSEYFKSPVNQRPNSTEKSRFCPFCGKPAQPGQDTEFCAYCGGRI